jgi:hypothetical protein
MLSEFSPFEPVVEKEGVLSKLGGGAGGHKNWKDRYFVLSDHLYYYGSKAEYAADPKNPLGRVNLLSYYVSRSDPEHFEFCVHAYPKVRQRAGRRPVSALPLPPPFLAGPHSPPSRARAPPRCLSPPPMVAAQSLTCRASSKSELDDWVNAVMAPLEALREVKTEGGKKEGSGKKAGRKAGRKAAAGGGGGGGEEEEDDE